MPEPREKPDRPHIKERTPRKRTEGEAFPYLRRPLADDISEVIGIPLNPTAPAPQEAPAPETVPVSLTPVQQTAPLSDTPPPLPETAPVQEAAPVRQTPSGFTMVTHQASDDVLPTLDVYSQSVLQRLLRLTWGHQKDVCKVGLPTLSKYCNISLSQTRRAVRMLIQRGFVEQVIQDFEDPAQELRGTVYRVLLERAPTRQRGATPRTAPVQQPPNKERAFKNSSKKVDASACPECKGDGYFFTDPADSTTLKLCRHERARAELSKTD